MKTIKPFYKHFKINVIDESVLKESRRGRYTLKEVIRANKCAHKYDGYFNKYIWLYDAYYNIYMCEFCNCFLTLANDKFYLTEVHLSRNDDRIMSVNVYGNYVIKKTPQEIKDDLWWEKFMKKQEKIYNVKQISKTLHVFEVQKPKVFEK